MDKKVVILVHPGLSYCKTVQYGSERAREMGAKVLLLGVIPEFNEVAMAIHEFAPYRTVSKRVEDETVGFLENAVQFCLDKDITVDTRVERGNIEEVLREVVKDKDIKLVVVPAPTKKTYHSAVLEALSRFAHSMVNHELQCPVVAVLAV